MIIRVLGSAAGGGLPQWNCRCSNCADARAGDVAVRPRSQSSLAVSPDGERWLLVNASPDVRTQLASLTAASNGRIRESPIAAVVLTDAEIDHTAGLLLLREGGRLTLHCTEFVRDALVFNGLLGTLSCYLNFEWVRMRLEEPFEPQGPAGRPLGVVIEGFAVPGDPPLHWRGGPTTAQGVVVGLRVRATDRRAGPALVYVPGAAAAGEELLRRIGAGDVLLWDGTFWSGDELVRLGVSQRPAQAMGHLPISGPEGALQRFRDVPASRKVLVHVNNTNPILREGSRERRQAADAGWEVAYDGMEIRI